MTLPAFEFEFYSATQAVILWFGLALLAILILLRQPKTLLLARTEQGRLRISAMRSIGCWRHAANRWVASLRPRLCATPQGKVCTKLR